MHPHYLYYSVGGIAGGVLVRLIFQSHWVFPSSFFVGLSIGALIALIVLGFLRARNILRSQDSYPWVTVTLIALLCCGAGIVRSEVTSERFMQSDLDSYVGQDVRLRGVVSDNPDQREAVTLITLTPKEVFDKATWSTLDSGRILASTSPFPRFVYGDTLEIRGTLELPQSFISDTGREFDYVTYLQKEGIKYSMSFVESEFIEHGSKFSLRRSLYQLKDALIDSIDQNIVQPEGGLLAGILLGEKRALGEGLEEAFRRTGVIHIVVLSGYNVTLVADFITRILRAFLGRRKALYTGIVGIVLFAILTGAGATIVRASIMAILVVIARSVGREYQITRALLFAGALMILQNPMILLYDLSFQLSFLATLGLIHIIPMIEDYFHWVPQKLNMRESLLATLSTQIMVLPLLIYAIGEISLIAPIVNVLVLIAVPYAMFVGFLMAVGGLTLPILGSILMIPTYFLLTYITRIVELFSAIPFASVMVPSIPLWSVCVMYGALLLILFRFRTRFQTSPSLGGRTPK